MVGSLVDGKLTSSFRLGDYLQKVVPLAIAK